MQPKIHFFSLTQEIRKRNLTDGRVNQSSWLEKVLLKKEARNE